MVAGFPVDPDSTATLTVQGTGSFDVMVRVPEWAKSSVRRRRHHLFAQACSEEQSFVKTDSGRTQAKLTLNDISLSFCCAQENLVSVNGVAVAGAPYTPQSYLRVSHSWKDGDKIEISFPMSLWTAPLNDYHPEHNATLAFMYGPLVLAGVNMTTDIWVPKGGTAVAKTNPAAFITRTSNATLSFEGAGEKTFLSAPSLPRFPCEQVMIYPDRLLLGQNL